MRAEVESAIKKEMEYARRKHPGSRNLIVALTEEVGELAQALLDGHDQAHIFSEAIQVAATAARLAEEGTTGFDYKFAYDHYEEMREARFLPKPIVNEERW